MLTVNDMWLKHIIAAAISVLLLHGCHRVSNSKFVPKNDWSTVILYQNSGHLTVYQMDPYVFFGRTRYSPDVGRMVETFSKRYISRSCEGGWIMKAKLTADPTDIGGRTGYYISRVTDLKIIDQNNYEEFVRRNSVVSPVFFCK